MIDITLLKVIHGDGKESTASEEAKKIIPYVRRTHVFGVENNFATEEEASFLENYWAGLLKDGSRSKARREISKSLEGMKPDKAGYMKSLYDILYVGKVPLFLFERWESEEERDRLVAFREGGGPRFDGGVARLKRGDWGGLRQIYDGMKIIVETTQARDEQIAKVLPTIEGRIRERYPFLKEDTLKYTFNMGASHNVEELVSGLNVVPLFSKKDALTIELSKLVRSSRLYEEVEGPMLDLVERL